MSGFHQGELAVQQLAGVASQAARLAGMLNPPQLDGGARQYLADRDLAMITSTDRHGRLWSSPLFGSPGFLDGRGAELRIGATPLPGDPLEHLTPGRPIAVLAVDFGRRRRVRVNGTLTGVADGQLTVLADQAYGNCPSYIQQRHPLTHAEPDEVDTWRGESWRPEDVALIRRADTFILGTTHPTRGVDASHRGGAPGFVRVDPVRVDPVRVDGGGLWWPDYPGNNLFNSLGNIAVDPATALLFPDFRTGTTVQLSGTATIEWLPAGSPGDDGGTGRRVRFHPTQVVTRTGLPLRSPDLVPFPRNPALVTS